MSSISVMPLHEKKVLSIAEAMSYLGSGKSNIYNLLERGELSSFKMATVAKFCARVVMNTFAGRGRSPAAKGLRLSPARIEFRRKPGRRRGSVQVMKAN
jgi:hypothetical protein